MIINMALRGLIAGAALTWGAMSAQALTVEQGETFSLTFNNLSFISSGTVNASATTNLSPDNILGPNESINLKFFENVDFTGLFSDFTFNTNAELSLTSIPIGFFVGGAWSDLNGSLLITMINGSIDIGNIVVQTSNTSGIYRETFQPPAPVPLPGALFLFGSVVAGAAGLAARRKRREGALKTTPA